MEASVDREGPLGRGSRQRLDRMASEGTPNPLTLKRSGDEEIEQVHLIADRDEADEFTVSFRHDETEADAGQVRSMGPLRHGLPERLGGVGIDNQLSFDRTRQSSDGSGVSGSRRALILRYHQAVSLRIQGEVLRCPSISGATSSAFSLPRSWLPPGSTTSRASGRSAARR